MRFGECAAPIVVATLLAACTPTYSKGCSTQRGDVVTRGPVVVRHYANRYQAAKGERFLRWCEIEVGGELLSSPTGSPAAGACAVSPAEDLVAVLYAWIEGDDGHSHLLQIVDGRRIEHTLERGGGESAWLDRGHLYAQDAQVFDLVGQTVHAFPEKDLWGHSASPDGKAVSARSPLMGPTIRFFVMRLPAGTVETRTLVCAEHAWLQPPPGSPAPFQDHVRWVARSGGSYDLEIDP